MTMEKQTGPFFVILKSDLNHHWIEILGTHYHADESQYWFFNGFIESDMQSPITVIPRDMIHCIIQAKDVDNIDFVNPGDQTITQTILNCQKHFRDRIPPDFPPSLASLDSE